MMRPVTHRRQAVKRVEVGRQQRRRMVAHKLEHAGRLPQQPVPLRSERLDLTLCRPSLKKAMQLGRQGAQAWQATRTCALQTVKPFQVDVCP